MGIRVRNEKNYGPLDQQYPMDEEASHIINGKIVIIATFYLTFLISLLSPYSREATQQHRLPSHLPLNILELQQ